MKSVFTALVVGLGLMLTGCGDGADENKTPEQIKQEVTTLDTAKIQKMVETYTKAVEAKSAELKVEVDKLAKIPLKDMLGDEAKKCQANIKNLTASLDKLKANLAAYADGLKAQQK